jgi:hypothetical protein
MLHPLPLHLITQKERKIIQHKNIVTTKEAKQ